MILLITCNTIYTLQQIDGISTDTKPTDVPNGSRFLELDTGKVYMFDADSSVWLEFTGTVRW